ncbi:hypothetical protein AcW1_008273 [Taiwanofungus camphoratus]|nr:hypothetical protein AcW1_008273 [Antrodia cinnamomea]KAI0956049.1 hypothetical protein AcV7_006557 [Antrodia cinnamomea]
MLSLAEFVVWIVGVAVLVFCYFPTSSRPRYCQTDTECADVHTNSPARPVRAKRSAFKATRLTAYTFLIVETDDIYSEHPFIYAKLIPAANTILLLDTGCGGVSNDSNIEVTSLREFIETVGVEDNDGRALNEGGKMRYIVVLSHCHYDHILGVEQFAHDSPILESAHSPTFVSRFNLPAHSLCQSLSVRTPSFTPTLVPHFHRIVSISGVSLGVTLLHTPGHTPDELALWDEEELMLYVGDTLYEWEHIVFPNEGSIVTWLTTIDQLVAFVLSSRSPYEVTINSGHRTALRPALDVLRTAKQFMLDVLIGKEKVRSRAKKRGLDYVEYVQKGRRYSLICPERLIQEARERARL